MTAHPIVHIEIPAHDRERSAGFYADLFGWTMEHFPEYDYSMFRAAPGPGGGIATIGGEQTREREVLIHVQTDDVEASLARAVELGATIVKPPAAIPGGGWYGIFADPAGNRIALTTLGSA
jgi:uncharacterized protein